MAFTVTEDTVFVAGDKRIVFATLGFDSSYPTGGEALAASDFDQLSGIEEVVIASSPPEGTEVVVWDRANSKLKVFTADGTEQTNATDPGITALQVMVVGY